MSFRAMNEDSNGRCSGASCSVYSPPHNSSLSRVFNMLDSAAEHMMVNRDFQATFDICGKGLDSLSRMEPEDNRCEELKAAFCILGIQALAEMNQWHGVFSWVLQHYTCQEHVPAKIIQICILLYSKVGEPAVMQEATRLWLACSTNSSAAAFGSVAELYLLHILVPLKHLEEARELIAGEVGSVAFTEDQRRTALDIVKEHTHQNPEPSLGPIANSDSDLSAHPASNQGTLIHKLNNILKFLYRKCSNTSSGSFPLQKLLLAVLLFYMLFFRLDPAHQSAFMWITKLLQLIKQMWRSTFGPYYQALT